MLAEIGSSENVPNWYEEARAEKRRIMGSGHRVYKTYDPRARILGPLAERFTDRGEEVASMLQTAKALEQQVVATLGAEKGIFPNGDFYSGLVYRSLGIPQDMFTPTFAVSRVADWTARILEYLEHNRIFRPRAVYIGELDKPYVPIGSR